MKLYRFSPIGNKEQLLDAIKYIHESCYKLCKQSFGYYLPNAGNMGVFCHYDDEYSYLVKLREEMTEPSDNVDQKYFRLRKPIIIPADGEIPEATYTYLYIRKPDPYRHHVGDVDFYVESNQYTDLKQSLLDGKERKGARIFPRGDLDMIELYDPDSDVLAYVSQKTMTEKVRVKVNLKTKEML
ncbi:MAG TPA: hypothetical protein VGE59_02190 [Patescibacteria group bacterium]